MVTDNTYSPTTALAETDTKITISFGGKTCEQAITVSAAPAEELGGADQIKIGR